MREADVQIRYVFLLGTLCAVAVPPVVFIATALLSGLSPAETVSATIGQYSTSRLNLLIMGALGAVPFGILSLALVLFRRFGRGLRVERMAIGGGVFILATMLWAHTTYWRLFLPERVAPMWPHGLELLIGPIFFAPVMALAGLLLGWVAERASMTKPGRPV